MNGVLLVDKPKGWTSHDVVAKVRGILKKQTGEKVKVGHGGTLDPLATGLLVILVGGYTKRAQEFSKLDKTYQATIKLGQTSSTGDEEGQKLKTSNKKPTEAEVNQALKHFTGTIMQTPHQYSAVKIKGQRAYKLAREGKKPNIQPKEVKIFGFKDVFYDYPEVKFTVKVSSGTYIRSLAEDIGKQLGTGAYLAKLNRTKIGQYKLKDKAK